MGYSKSPATVRSILPQLRGIEEEQALIEWRVGPGQASRWAYKVREALRIAERHPEEFPSLTKKRALYEICEIAHDRVVARRVQVAAFDVNAGTILPASLVSMGSAVINVASVVQVVQAWLDRPNDNPINFVFELSNPEIKEVIAWAESMAWSLWQKGDTSDFMLVPKNVQIPVPWQVVSL